MATGLGTASVCVAATVAALLCVDGVSTSAAESPTRVALLPAGSRASVLVELDADVLKAATVDAPDDRTVTVEIGPVRQRVANQLLQAAKDSPLVDRVRLRAAPRGAEGAVLTIQVMAKQPVTGSVRRSRRRVYIDLAPRGNTPTPASPVASKDARQKPTALPTPVAPPSVPAPAVGVGVTAAGAAAVVSAAPSGATRAGASPSDLETTASQLAKAADVRGLERLKRDLEATRGAPGATAADAVAIDARLLRLDEYMREAQRNRLAADAALLRGDPASPATPRAPSTNAPAAALGGASTSSISDALSIVALRAFRPDLEKIAQAAAAWTGGQPPPTLVTLSAMLPRFRTQRPPASIAKAHANASAALDQLALVWASASADPPPEGQPPAAVQRVRAVLDEYLTLEKALDAKP